MLSFLFLDKEEGVKRGYFLVIKCLCFFFSILVMCVNVTFNKFCVYLASASY